MNIGTKETEQWHKWHRPIMKREPMAGKREPMTALAGKRTGGKCLFVCDAQLLVAITCRGILSTGNCGKSIRLSLSKTLCSVLSLLENGCL